MSKCPIVLGASDVVKIPRCVKIQWCAIVLGVSSCPILLGASDAKISFHVGSQWLSYFTGSQRCQNVPLCWEVAVRS